MGENPPDGAIIDYYLAGPGALPVTGEILDSQGHLVRKFSSSDNPDQTQEEIAKQLIPLYLIRMPKTLSPDQGMHRWVWDLHYPVPLSTRHEYPISAVPHDTPRYPLGPRALPGQYTVRLTSDRTNLSSVMPASTRTVVVSAPLAIKMDTRANTPLAGFQQQFRAQTDLADKMTKTSMALAQAHSLSDQLEKISAEASGSLKDSIAEFGKKLDAILDTPAATAGAPESAPQETTPRAAKSAEPEATLPKVSSDISTLYAEIDRADAAPTSAQARAHLEIGRNFSAAIKSWEELKSGDIPALNRQLSSAGLPELRLESNPQPLEESSGDEE